MIRSTHISRFRQCQRCGARAGELKENLPGTQVYDAIVVGTGAGGATAMKILCEAGLKVLALNSGPRTIPAKDYRQHRQVYNLTYRGFGDPEILAHCAHQEHYTWKKVNSMTVLIYGSTM